MFYLRRLSKGNSVFKFADTAAVQEMEADLLGQELRTSQNKLSVWKCSSLEPDDSEEAIKAALFSSNGLLTTKLVAIRKDEIENIGLPIEKSPGKTGYIGLASLHANISDLNYETIGSVMGLLHDICGNTDRIITIQKQKFQSMALDAYKMDKLDFSQMPEHLRNNVKKLLKKELGVELNDDNSAKSDATFDGKS